MAEVTPCPSYDNQNRVPAAATGKPPLRRRRATRREHTTMTAGAHGQRACVVDAFADVS